ncbi:MAG: L,D-transpeptidase family protein [Chloroflexi bacterium]|nr:L,D-transpeptidase family protein [Chloroflexota bacterium]
MRRVSLALCLSILLLVAVLLLPAGAEGAGFTGFVNTDALNVRASPSTSSAVIDVLTFGEQVTVIAQVDGQMVNGTSTWYQIASGGYVLSAYVSQALQGSGPGPVGFLDRWIDVNLSTQTATAYVGNLLVHVAAVTTGRPANPTPTGTFGVFSRVFSETMISTTPGDEYHMENVLFTQYFLGGGYALHYNYWQPDSVFGNTPTSHGCVGMRYGDAAFFWNFATFGTPVVIHY